MKLIILLSFNSQLFQTSSSPFSTYLSNHRWKPLPGFRGSLGLEEEPQSPPSVRGGDTSLFSLPSDSANESTPHTSNVSLTTTITTVVSPERYGTDIYKQQQRSYFDSSDHNKDDIDRLIMRKTVESLARVLHRLEVCCLYLKSKMRAAEKSKVIEDVQNIYFELLNFSAADLKLVINSFEMEFDEPQFLTRTISDDQDIVVSRPVPPPLSFYEKEKNTIQGHAASTREMLRVNIVQCDDDDDDDDNVNQSIECDLWSPTTNDMNSLIYPQSIEENGTAVNGEYATLVDEEEPVDDLRRTVGSFEHESVEDEREAAPSWDEDENGRDHTGSFPATFARRVVAQRSRKSRFWKKRFMALKNRGRQATAE